MKKHCWLAKRYEKGWRLGFVYGNEKTRWLPFWFRNQVDLTKALKANIVYIHMAYEGYDK